MKYSDNEMCARLEHSPEDNQEILKVLAANGWDVLKTFEVIWSHGCAKTLHREGAGMLFRLIERIKKEHFTLPVSAQKQILRDVIYENALFGR